MLLAIIPFVVWGAVALAGALGVGVGVACSNSSSSSGSSGSSGSGGLGGTTPSESGPEPHEPQRPLKPACLLAGYSGAGKSEFLCALQDYVNNNGNRKTHSRGSTISTEQPTIMVSGIQITCIDGPGNLDGGQAERYMKFLDRAFNSGEPRKFVVVFVADLTTLLNSVEARKHVKSDLELLNGYALAACDNPDTLKDRRVKFLCIGSHVDKLQKNQIDQLQNDFVGWFTRNVNCAFFDTEYVVADLYNDCLAAARFCKYVESL